MDFVSVLLSLGVLGSEELKPHWWSPTCSRLRVVAHSGPAVEAGVVIHVTVSCTLASARPSGVDGVHSSLFSRGCTASISLLAVLRGIAWCTVSDFVLGNYPRKVEQSFFWKLLKKDVRRAHKFIASSWQLEGGYHSYERPLCVRAAACCVHDAY